MEDILNGELGIGHFRHFLDLKVKKAERVIVKAVVDIIKDTLLGASRQVFLDRAVSRHPQNYLVVGFKFRFIGHQISPPIRL